MKYQTLMVALFTLAITGCAKEEQAAVEEADEAEAPLPAVEAAPVENMGWRNEAFVEHMHAHAEKLDELNFALADGDLDGAMTPAYWLAQHDSIEGIPPDLQSYVTGIRAAASSVEEADDLETARAEAQRITEECQGCHDASGIEVE
ncbi:MAG: hypothetical protein OEV02_01735 [Gammaproteobacteria bacterium]|nr:hypothetical protein [Gammaproteobacteria bacterium]